MVGGGLLFLPEISTENVPLENAEFQSIFAYSASAVTLRERSSVMTTR